MELGLNASSALTVVMKCSSLKQPEDKHLASQHKPQERPINGSPYGEHPVEEEAGRNRNRHYNVENTGVTGSYPNLRINVALQRDNQCSQHCGECTG